MRLGYNHFLSFKGRRPDVKRPVFVYRNLNGDKNHLYSIKQDGLVMGHSNRLVLSECSFIVSQAGQRRVRKTKHKNVHAYVKGWIALKGAMGSDGRDGSRWPVKIEYNPYKDKGFVWRQFSNMVVKSAMAVVLCPDGVFAAYTD